MSQRILSEREKVVREAQVSLGRYGIKISELQVHPSVFYSLIEEGVAFTITFSTKKDECGSSYCGIPIKQAV